MRETKLLFCGDVCFSHQCFRDPKTSVPDHAVSILSGMMPILDGADKVIMNLETPLAPAGVGAPIRKSGPNLISDPAWVSFLEAAGCGLAVMANNHTGDYGDDALAFTTGLLSEHSIPYIGAGSDIDEAYSAYRFTSDGTSISIIAVCENEFGTAGKNSAGTAGYDPDLIGGKIAEEKLVSDKVIVVFHGGCEHDPVPSPGCRARYRNLVRLGADAVIAGHTHCMQGYEYFLGCPIVYSMGNFLFKWSSIQDEPWYRGYIAELSIGDKLTVRPIPYRFETDGSKLHPLTGEELKKTLAYIEKLSLIIPDTDELLRLYDGWCTISGLSYIKGLVAKDEYFSAERSPDGIAGLRNLLSCESHNELMRRTLELAFTGRLGEAKEIAAEIRELQKVPT